MNFNEYTEKALRTCHTTGDAKVVEGAMGVSSEGGEVLDLIKKWQFQGHELDLEEVQKELGDVLWYMAELIDGLGLNFETILLKNLKKLKARYPDGFNADKSINRSE
jgi:NTP pyrophosphatase (non-canonical NTP hydrolase)